MSTITKYRPRSWEEVLGHGTTVKSIQAAIKKGKSRTFVLTGPPGIGKTTIARLIAKEVGAKKGNIIEYDGANQTGIDDIRELLNRLSYAPLDDSPRVVIIDECHGITANSWKALLKPLEEPEEGVFWVLCTSEPDKVPKAIYTRALTAHLKPVEEETIEKLLRKVRHNEELKIKDEGIKLLAAEAKGSPRQALALLAECGDMKGIEDIKASIQHFGEPKEVIDLCRLFLRRPKEWKVYADMLRAIKIAPEGARIVIMRYMASCMLSGNMGIAKPAFAVMEQFDQPFVDREGNAPLVLATARVWANS